MQNRVEGTILQCTPTQWCYNGELLPNSHIPFFSSSFFDSLFSSVFFYADISHNSGPNPLFFSLHTLSLTDLIHSQGNQKQDSKFKSLPSPYFRSDLLCLSAECFSLGKLTSNSPSSLAHFSVNSPHRFLLLRFKTEVNSSQSTPSFNGELRWSPIPVHLSFKVTSICTF